MHSWCCFSVQPLRQPGLDLDKEQKKSSRILANLPFVGCQGFNVHQPLTVLPTRADGLIQSGREAASLFPPSHVFSLPLSPQPTHSRSLTLSSLPRDPLVFLTPHLPIRNDLRLFSSKSPPCPRETGCQLESAKLLFAPL